VCEGKRKRDRQRVKKRKKERERERQTDRFLGDREEPLKRKKKVKKEIS